MTLSEAAAYLRVPEELVLRQVGPNGLPGRLFDSEWRFLKSALQEWLRTPAPPSSPEALRAAAGAWKTTRLWTRCCVTFMNVAAGRTGDECPAGHGCGHPVFAGRRRSSAVLAMTVVATDSDAANPPWCMSSSWRPRWALLRRAAPARRNERDLAKPWSSRWARIGSRVRPTAGQQKLRKIGRGDLLIAAIAAERGDAIDAEHS